MRAFHIHPVSGDDFNSIRNNGMWFQRWQAGYEDILKRGYPCPKFKTTILAELHSPNTPDFLHGGAGDVPFIVSHRTKAIIRQHNLSGIRFSGVEVVKLATKGQRKKVPKLGEPEDQIIKAKDLSSELECPELHAVYAIGRLEIIPDFPTGRCPGTGYVTPFRLPRSANMPDLWRPTIKGRTFAAWVYCSERFREKITKAALSNIGFEPFEKQMTRFRASIQSKRSVDYDKGD